MNRRDILAGFRDGIPIGMGYYAVAFSLGIFAGKTGLEPIAGFIGSFFTRASAGEYGVYSLMAICATIPEVMLMSLITNMRYLLMSTALSQRIAKGEPMWKRVLMACCITDEVFAIAINRKGNIPLSYPAGATLLAGTCWAAGTASGIMAGDVLPSAIVSALSVALYGMFLAIIIPPVKEDKAIRWSVLASFILSGICASAPILKDKISSGTRTIILTIIISAIAAYLRPIKEKKDEC